MTPSSGLFIFRKKELTRSSYIILIAVFSCMLPLTACDGGLKPPDAPAPYGTIEGTVHYEGTWPPADSLNDLRFVAFKVIPQSSSDFLNFQNFVFSERLQYNVESDSFRIEEIENGTYPYNGIAWQFGGLTDWRPAGIYSENNGLITVQGDTVKITVFVDFDNLPPFPPF